MSYNKKDTVVLTYNANKKRLRCEGQILLDEVLNEAVAEMDEQFTEALNRGEVLTIEGSRAEFRRFLRAASEKLLNAAPKKGEQHGLPVKK